MKNNKIRVLIVDDSAVVRQTLEDIISSDPDLEVMATASDPYIAAQKIKQELPDVITLDVEMPKMDGITFLKKIMSQCPVPVVMCSSLTKKGYDTALKAFEYGAVEIIEKPTVNIKQFLEDSKIKICDTIKAASMVSVSRIMIDGSKSLMPPVHSNCQKPAVKIDTSIKPLHKMEVAPKLTAYRIVFFI